MFIGFILALWLSAILPTLVDVILKRRYREVWSGTVVSDRGPYRSNAPAADGRPTAAPRATKLATWTCLYFAQGLLVAPLLLAGGFLLVAVAEIQPNGELYSVLGMTIGAGTLALATYGLTLQAALLLLQARPTEARGAVVWSSAWAVLLCAFATWSWYATFEKEYWPDADLLAIVTVAAMHCALPWLLARGIRAAEWRLAREHGPPAPSPTIGLLRQAPQVHTPLN